MKLGFVYAGQGSQVVGMGKELYDTNSIYKETIDNINLDFDLKDISFNGPDEELKKTENTQPCMVAYAIGITKILFDKGIKPDMCLGLSLGEYSALYASGVLTEEEVLKLARFRGKAMANAAKGVDCSMYAILGLDRDVVKNACEEAQKNNPDEVAVISNLNCPGQIVIGGSTKAIEDAVKVCTENGAKRCIKLNVSGPFHTPLMKKAGDDLRDYFKNIDFKDMQIPVVFNALGTEILDNNIPELLEKQVQSSVKLEDSIKYMIENGVDTFIEIGPGKVISGFIRKINRKLKCYSAEDLESLEQLVR